ncbi:Putative holliday junction resolvase [Methyloversatilis universalis FAM5]|jgi:putative Holliday junction resolvase|uniref:Putative pre-16S rRNA nuclease n=1 Tax=Methyloversatilis universalis (strain ATCC BAA-1314 / DSM 25237 / JCM 13912 / CCUG 52030 / FAM5) TaxID=1000565 RepID=F5RFH0_METUF|nr:Holliday junction resolvase RuvX [Methyloversatilis universalis]EGK70826.1 Putative holliday junction resolvase [Methyloversatilis universalis FAM5]
MPDPAALPARGTVLAFDFGEKRIGVAVGECELRTASALTTLDAETNDARWSGIGRLLDEWKPALLVVGLPLSPDGEPHDMTARAQRFARQLEGRYRLPVALQDERFTSAEADAQLRDGGQKDWRERKKQLDAHAAQLILKDYFDVTA